MFKPKLNLRQKFGNGLGAPIYIGLFTSRWSG